MPIDTIRLPGTPVITTTLGLGTTGLLGLPGEKGRREMLERAFDLGVRHYDTAPYYGYGEAERILGRFIRTRRDRVTVTTKFGIQPPRVGGLSTLAGMARRMTTHLAPLRRLLAKQAGRLVRREAFTVNDARRSLEASLKALQTDYIDIYLLHEAGPAETASDELLSFLTQQVHKGLIRSFGIGSEFDRTIGVIGSHPGYACVIQLENNVLRRNLAAVPQTATRAVITHRALGDALKVLITSLRADPEMAGRWSGDIGADCGRDSVVSGLMLAYAARENNKGVVIFSTRSSAHLERNIRVVADEAFTDSQISIFAKLVEADVMPKVRLRG